MVLAPIDRSFSSVFEVGNPWDPTRGILWDPIWDAMWDEEGYSLGYTVGLPFEWILGLPLECTAGLLFGEKGRRVDSDAGCRSGEDIVDACEGAMTR